MDEWKGETSMKTRFSLIFLLVLSGTLIFSPVSAQDTVFMDESNDWISPPFETTKNTRIEWNAYPVEGANNPLFSFIVVEEGMGVVRKETGLQGMAFLDQVMRCHIEVTGADIRIWEIRLFGLAQPVVTTTPTTTGVPPVTPPEPNPPEGVVTVTQTVAVWEELPPQSWVVTWGYIGIGILGTLVVLLGILLVMLKKDIEVVFARPIKEEEEEKENEEEG